MNKLLVAISLTLLCSLAFEHVSGYMYNVNIFMSDRYFEPIDATIELRMMSGNQYEEIVSTERNRLEANRVISFSLDCSYKVEEITEVQFTYKIPLLFRPIRFFITRHRINVKAIQVVPVYLNDSFARQMNSKNFETENGELQAQSGERYSFSQLIEPDFLDNTLIETIN